MINVYSFVLSFHGTGNGCYFCIQYHCYVCCSNLTTYMVSTIVMFEHIPRIKKKRKKNPRTITNSFFLPSLILIRVLSSCACLCVRNLWRKSGTEQMGPTFSCENSVKGWHGRGHNGDLGCYRSLPGLDVLPLVFLLLGPWLGSVFHDSWNLASRKSYEGQRVDVGFSFDKENYYFCLETSSDDQLSVEVLLLFILTTFGSRSAFLCVFSDFVWGLLYTVPVETEVTQDKSYPANSVSVLDSFLSRRLWLVFNGLLEAWSYLLTSYPVSVLWTCSTGEERLMNLQVRQLWALSVGKKVNPVCMRRARSWGRFKGIKSYLNKSKLKPSPCALTPRAANGRITNV